jgi:hypothetical protein
MMPVALIVIDPDAVIWSAPPPPPPAPPARFVLTTLPP